MRTAATLIVSVLKREVRGKERERDEERERERDEERERERDEEARRSRREVEVRNSGFRLWALGARMRRGEGVGERLR
jgi:hypothetical protein